jgi:hypothetical protein
VRSKSGYDLYDHPWKDIMIFILGIDGDMGSLVNVFTF